MGVIHTTWVEVSLGGLRHNLAEVRELVGASVKIMAVVKADAYGHGAGETARTLADAGADYLGVTTPEEGIELREAGLSTPILVFSPLLPDQVDSALATDLEQTVCDLRLAESISAAAEKAGKLARVHVKVDTGMGRLGVPIDDCPEFMYRLLNLNGIEVAGVYMHFANAGDRNPSHAREQNARFREIIRLLEGKDIPTGICHAANSSAILNLPESRYDMVRPGTILYGQYPGRHMKRKLDLQETWRLKTRVHALRKLPAGTKVGYGSEFVTRRPTVVAILPIGYADGFTLIPESLARRASGPLRQVVGKLVGAAGGPYVTVRGKRALIIGRVSMQMCSADVTELPEVQVGDEVTIPARRVTTSSRIPKVYVE